VVVRSRGVMEKCSLCIQRIQAAKLTAEQEGRPVADGDIQTACQQVCPAEAIVFGDLADPNSRVSRLNRSRRNYRVLEELGTRPNVSYLTKVKNACRRPSSTCRRLAGSRGLDGGGSTSRSRSARSPTTSRAR